MRRKWIATAAKRSQYPIPFISFAAMADAMVIDASAIAGPSSSVNTVKPSASTSASKSKSGPPSKRTAYRPHSSIEPFYTGAGHTALSSDGRFLFTSIDEELLVTDLSVGTGRVVKRLEVVS